ncbi:MAG: HhH-GPD-type base excision DNA repair protein [Acidimicrobiia bacterium]
MPKTAVMPVTGDTTADRLLEKNPLALLIGMLLDQQVPMEWAFRGPQTLTERVGSLDPEVIAAMDPEAFVALCCEKPAIHRFPAAMAKRIQALCTIVHDEYRGNAARIWKGVDDPREIKARLSKLPGYGDEKARIFLAILGKRFGVAPEGWERVATPFSDGRMRSVADVSSHAALLEVRAFKQRQKARGKGKAD